MELDPIESLLVSSEDQDPAHGALPSSGTAIGKSEQAKVGEIIAERYQILNHIGTGGMASVYRVADKTSGQVYALKMMSSRGARKDALLKRLEHEAMAARNLSHANICAVYDFGVNKDGTPFLVMEFVAGDNLDHLLKIEKTFDEKRTLNIFMQLAAALHYAHEHGVIHCDLKPSNVLLTKKFGEEELAKIVDFGIAKLADQHNTDKSKLIQTGEFIGSPLYMSPEQCKGDRLDRRSDIYSLACMIHELLSGTAPFSGDNPIKVILKHLESEPPALSSDQVSRDLQTVISHCLEKSPANRYSTAEAVLADLQKVKDGRRVQKYQKKNSTKPLHILLAILVAAGITLGATQFISQWAPIDQAWQTNQSSGINFFNQGRYVQSAAAFEEAVQTPGIKASQKLDSLRALALVCHLTGKAAEESAYRTQIESLDSALNANEANSDANLNQLQKLMEDQSSKNERDKLAKQLAFEFLKTAYLLNMADQPGKALELLDSAIDQLESKMDPNSAPIKALELERAFTLTKQSQLGKEAENDRNLELAAAKSIIAQSYASTAPEQALKQSQAAASFVLKFRPADLTHRGKSRAIEILAAHARLLSKSRSPDLAKYQKLVDDYRYEK